MFNNSKYGNVLTVILVVAIIAIIGIIGIVGYRVYKAYYIDNGAIAAATEFEDVVSIENNTVNQNTVKPIIDGVNESISTTTTTEQTTTYKGFTVVGTIQIPSINLN